MFKKNTFSFRKFILVSGCIGLSFFAIYKIRILETKNNKGAISNTCIDSLKIAGKVSELAQSEFAAMKFTKSSFPIELLFKGEDNQVLKISDFSGKTVLVNLWATWCASCRNEMSSLNNLQKQIGDKDFEIVAINLDKDSNEKSRTFVKKMGFNELAYYHDSSMGVFNTIKTKGLAFGLPVSIILDKQGCLISTLNGAAVWDSENAKKLITLIKEVQRSKVS